MPEVPAHPQEGLATRHGQPLIGVPTKEGADEVVHYFTSEEEADRALSHSSGSIQRALSLIGAWEQLDAEDGPDMLEELDRIRRESNPNPPFEL